MGEKTHYLISDYLKLLEQWEASPENITKIKEGLAEEMRYEFDASKEKNYTDLSFWEWGGLSEHYYGENIDDQLESTIQRVWNNLDQLINSPWIEKIKTIMNGNNHIYIENPKNPDFEAMKVEIWTLPNLRDISIMASPDFWVIFSGNNYLILDRKSGKEPQDLIGISDQIKVYALKLLLKKKRKAELWDTEIEGYEVYLPSAKSYGGKIEQKDIDDIIQKISQDTTFQKTFLVDQDAYSNTPLASTTFSRTNSERKCETCTFRKVCSDLSTFE